jgi:hypothetical protein
MTRPKSAPAPGRTEKQVLAQILEALLAFGIDVERQNTGAGINPTGRAIRFGKPGNADISGMLPDGRKLDIEIKREGFDPSKLRGAKREHFERQLSRLRKTNENGGVGLWTDDAEEFMRVILPLLLDGSSVEEPGFGRLVIKRKAEA